MHASPEISVVVPIYNNRATLAELLNRLDQALGPVGSCEYVFVVDGSPDDSLAVLVELQADHEQLRVLELARNHGQHAALCAGFEAARGQVILILDGDLQQAPEDLPKFVEAWRTGHDFVSGWRTKRRDPLRRRLGSIALNWLVRSVTKVPLRDWGCPMAAIDRSLIEQVPQAGEQRRFLKPLIAKLSNRWHEIGIEAEARDGESAYSMLALIGLSLDFIVSFVRRPFPRLAGFGLAVLVGSILIVGGYVPLRLLHVIEGQPRLQVLVTFSALFGFLAVSLGMLGEYIHRIYRLMQGEAFFEVRKEHKR